MISKEIYFHILNEKADMRLSTNKTKTIVFKGRKI
jgi:hypothetical protein